MEPVDLGTIKFRREQLDRWEAGQLHPVWARRFPDLFDPDDVRLATTQHPEGYHFFEWFAAIVLHHATGYLALVEKYQSAAHPSKKRIAERLLPPEIQEMLNDRTTVGGKVGPDLLMYAPDESDWFFCEVKGQTDPFGDDQRKRFEALGIASQKPVRVLRIVGDEPRRYESF